MSKETRYAIEMVDPDGEAVYTVVDTPEELGNYVRVNAGDAAWYRISVTDLEALGMLRIHETFGED